MQQLSGLYIAATKAAGRGVFTVKAISPGDLIEVCPVIILKSFEKPIIHRSSLHDYYFLWGKQLDRFALALGYGSLYNHAENPNATFFLDLSNNTIDITCASPILPGEEITINYLGDGGNVDDLWFDIVK